MPKKTADQWFAEYGESHQDHTNELIHWICVPAIFFCVLGFVWSIPVPAALAETLPWFNWSLLAIALVFLFYTRLSLVLAVAMLVFMTLCHAALLELEFRAPWAIWKICLALFAVAWIGQFIGHKVEGKKPSFLKDVQFLLIGPAWLMSLAFRKVGLKY